MKSYKKLIIAILVVILLGAGTYSVYLTFFKNEDSTVSMDTKKKVQKVKVKDIKVTGFTFIYGFYNGKIIGQFLDDKVNQGTYSVGTYDTANNKVEYIEYDKANYCYNYGSKVSHNGGKILYQKGHHDKNNKFIEAIGVYDLANNKKKVLRNLTDTYPAPTSLDPWSENGRYAVLAMARDTLKTSDISIYDTNTGRQKELKSNTITNLMMLNPKVSNDGKRLYFSVVSKKERELANKGKKDFAPNALFSVSVDNVKDLRDEDENVNSAYFYLTRDSKSAIYSRLEGKKYLNVVQKFFNADKGKKENVLIKNCNVFSISPDTKKIAYLVGVDDSSVASDLYIADIKWKNGNAKLFNKKFIYKAKFTDVPYWSNDNNSIAEAHGKSIYVFELKNN